MPITKPALPPKAGYVEREINGKRVYVKLETEETRRIAELESILDANGMPTKPPETLDEHKAARIAQSKTDLAAYLAAHPLQWTDGEYYAITAEKQQQLTSKIMSATMAQTMSADYHLTWNSTGEVCKEWTLADLTALAFAIDARVTALVTYQQTQEVAMRSAATMEELDAIEVNYDSVQ